MLERWARDLRQGGRPGLIRASRLALTVSFLAMAVPGLLLGALLTLDHRSVMPVEARFGLLLIGVVLAAVALQLAVRAVRNKTVTAEQATLTGAFQAGSAPGVVFLLGCTMLSYPAFMLLFWAFSGLLFWLVWRQYPGWIRMPKTQHTHTESAASRSAAPTVMLSSQPTLSGGAIEPEAQHQEPKEHKKLPPH